MVIQPLSRQSASCGWYCLSRNPLRNLVNTHPCNIFNLTNPLQPLFLILILCPIWPFSNLWYNKPFQLSLYQTPSISDSSNHLLTHQPMTPTDSSWCGHFIIGFSLFLNPTHQGFLSNPMPNLINLKYGPSIPYNQRSFFLVPFYPFYGSSSGDLLSWFRSTNHNLYFVDSSIDLNPTTPSFFWCGLILLFVSLPSHDLILVFIPSAFHLLLFSHWIMELIYSYTLLDSTGDYSHT